MIAPGTAVVTLAHGRRHHLERQHASLLAGSVRPASYVVVAMADPDLLEWRPPGALVPQVVDCPGAADALPLARARNLGVAAALSAGASTVVLLDVDCLAGSQLVAGYAQAVDARPDVVWSGPVTYLPPASSYPLAELAALDRPHGARPSPAPGERVVGGDWRLFWSLSFALSAEAWAATGGFCEDYVGYGGEDTDFGQTAQAAGLGLGWAGTPRAYHQHHPSGDPRSRAADVVRNAGVFHRRWGWWPMEGWLADLERDGLAVRTDDGWALTHQTPTPETPADQPELSRA